MHCVVFTLIACSLWACAGARASRETAPQISWHCAFDPEHSRSGPISVVVNGRSFVLVRQGASACRILERSEYRAHDIPDQAISAAAGWFAGGGEEFYASLQRQTLLVYHRLVEETGPLHPRYRVIARIPLHPTTPNQTLGRTADRPSERLKEEL